jgi:beta-mannosidase
MRLHQKAGDGNGKMARGLARHLPEPRTMEERHYLTQLNQARAIAFGIERYRSQRPHCMGTIVWQLNDCWPVTSWSAVDGDGRRKPLRHGLRRSNAEGLVTLQPGDRRLELVAVNDGITDWTVEGEVQRVDFGGEILASQSVSFTVPALDLVAVPMAEVIATPETPAAEVVVVARLTGARTATLLFAEDKELELDDLHLAVTVGEWTDGVQSVELSASVFARGVSFPTG